VRAVALPLPFHAQFTDEKYLQETNSRRRYLTAVDSRYYESLSAASKKSLEFQGGPFTGTELAAFEADPLREQMVNLRLWDDRAKVPGVEELTPRAGEYLGMIVGHLERQLHVHVAG
jgi:predicted HD phosphohydrolase